MSKSINLLPPELRKDVGSEVRGSLKRIVLLSALAVGVVSYAGFLGWSFYAEMALKKVQRELDNLKPRNAQVQSYEKKNKELEERIALLETIEGKRVKWTAILQDVNNRLPQNMWITELSCDSEGKIKVKGLAADLSLVGVFLYQLNQLPYFSSFTLEKASEIKLGEVTQTEFSLTGTLKKEVK